MNNVAVPSMYNDEFGSTSTYFQSRETDDPTDTTFKWNRRTDVLAGYQYFVGRPRLRLVRSIAEPCLGHDQYFPGDLVNDNYCFPWNNDEQGIDTMQTVPSTLNISGIPMQYNEFQNGGSSNMANIGNVPQAGYAYDLPTNRTETLTALDALHQSNEFLSLNTRAIVLEFVVVNRDINIVSSVKLTTEFTTSGLVVPSFFIRSVKFSQLEDGANDMVLMTAQMIMYCCFIIRVVTWIWSMCKMQPLIREIERHIMEDTRERREKNEILNNIVRIKEHRQSFQLEKERKAKKKKLNLLKKGIVYNSKKLRVMSAVREREGHTNKSMHQISHNTNSSNTSAISMSGGINHGIDLVESDYDYDEPSATKEVQIRANHSTKKCCGQRIKCPKLHLAPNTERHHWTTEDTCSPYEQDREDIHDVICRCKPLGRSGGCFACISRLFHCLHKCCCCRCCSDDCRLNVEETCDYLKDEKHEKVPTLSMVKVTSCKHMFQLICPCFRTPTHGATSNVNRIDSGGGRRRQRTSSVGESGTKMYNNGCDCSHQVLSRGYGTFFTQSLLFEIGLVATYITIVYFHVQESILFDKGLAQSITSGTPLSKSSRANLYNPSLHRYIRDNHWRVICIGVVASVTMIEWLVWLSKLSRTFSVLFMIVEDMFLRLMQFAIFFVTVSGVFGVFRYVVFGMEIGTFGLMDYLISPFKEINGERVVYTEMQSRANATLSSVVDTAFIFIMILLMANLLIAFMADAYGDMMQTGNARYAYNQFEAIKLARFAGHAGLAPLGVVDECHPMGKITSDLTYASSFRSKQKEEENRLASGEKKKKWKKGCCSFAVMRGFQY